MATPWLSLNCWAFAKKLRHKHVAQKNKEMRHLGDANEFKESIYKRINNQRNQSVTKWLFGIFDKFQQWIT
jgi:hypothetical protein